MRLASCAIPVVALLTFSASADVSISTVCLPGGASSVGSYTLSSVIAQPTACTTQLVGAMECDPGYLCVEAADLGKVGDINHDVGLPDFRGQVDYVLRLRIWQASSYLIGLMFPRAVCLRWVL